MSCVALVHGCSRQSATFSCYASVRPETGRTIHFDHDTLRSWLLCCSSREGTLLLSSILHARVWGRSGETFGRTFWRILEDGQTGRILRGVAIYIFLSSASVKLMKRPGILLSILVSNCALCSRVLSCVLLKQSVIFWHWFASTSQVKWSAPQSGHIKIC